jgi:1-acyl-sn-glycerol-3-phosphate acyltransferase
MNQRHSQTLSGPPPPRQGQLSKWFAGRGSSPLGNNLERFDPDFIAEVVKKLSTLYGPGKYFDLSMQGLSGLPPPPVILVSNHSGGTTIPDVWGFGVVWYRHFGVQRPLHILCHELLHAVPPFSRFFERIGAVRASLKTARESLRLGRDVLIYPGGDLDTWRPYAKRYQVEFGRRTGYARLAIETGVPVVPIAHAGAHETLRVLTSGRSFARAVGLHRIARAEIWPIHLSLPWGLALGPWPHIPWPARFRYLVGAPMTAPAGANEKEFGAEVEGAVQRQLDALQEEDLAWRRAKR